MTEQSVGFAIGRHRRRIDEIDTEIVALLNKRAIESLSIRALKASKQMDVHDPRREEEILERIARCNEGPFTDEGLQAVYELILKLSKEIP